MAVAPAPQPSDPAPLPSDPAPQPSDPATQVGRVSPKTKLSLYLGATFVISWMIAFTYMAFGRGFDHPAAQAVVILFMIPPAIVALGVKGALGQDPVISDFALRFNLSRWWLVAWTLPVAVYVLAALFSIMLPGVSLDLSIEHFVGQFPSEGEAFEQFLEETRREAAGGILHPVARMMLQALVTGITINAVRGLSEELGWRGLMHHELTALSRGSSTGGSSFALKGSAPLTDPRAFWRQSLIIGGVWGLWYMPLFVQGYWYSGAPWYGAFLGMAWCMAASPLFLLLRLKSNSIFVPAVLYGTFESFVHLPNVVRGGSDAISGIHGAAAVVVLALFDLLLWRALQRGFSLAPAVSSGDGVALVGEHEDQSEVSGDPASPLTADRSESASRISTKPKSTKRRKAKGGQRRRRR